MRPEEVHRSTFREIQIVLEGVTWQQEQEAHLVTVGAWTTAALMRKKRMPGLKTLLKEHKGPVARQTPEEQRTAVHMLAASFGHKIQRKPVSNG